MITSTQMGMRSKTYSAALIIGETCIKGEIEFISK